MALNGIKSNMSAYNGSIGEPESSQDTQCRNTTPIKKRQRRAPAPVTAPKRKKWNLCIGHHVYNVDAFRRAVFLRTGLDEHDKVGNIQTNENVLRGEQETRNAIKRLFEEEKGLAQAIKGSNKVRSSTQANAHSEGSQGSLAAPIVEHDFECLDAMDVQEQEANCKRLDVVEDTLQAVEAVKQEFSQWKAKLDELISTTKEQVAAAQAVEQQRYEQRLKDVQITFDKRVIELQEEQQRTIESRLRDEKNRYKDKLGENARDYDERLKALQTSDKADMLEAQKQMARETEARYSKQRIEDVQADHERHIKTMETRHRKALADQQASFDTQIETHQKYRSLQDKLRVAKTDQDNVNTLLAKQQKNAKAKVNHLEAQTQRLEHDKQDLEAKTQRLEGDNKNLKAQSQRLEANNQILKANTQRLEANNQILKANTQQLEANNRDFKAKTQQLEANNQIVQRQNEQLETDKQNLQQQQEKATKEQEVLERSREVDIDRIKKLQQVLKDKQERIQEQSVTISADSKRVKVLEKDMASLKNYIAGLETRVGSMDDEIQRKAVTISANEHSIRSLEGTNEKLRSDMEATAASLPKRQGRINELTKQPGRTDERVHRQDTTITALRLEVGEINTLRAELETKHQQVTQRIKDLRECLQRKEERITLLESAMMTNNKRTQEFEGTVFLQRNTSAADSASRSMSEISPSVRVRSQQTTSASSNSRANFPSGGVQSQQEICVSSNLRAISP